MTASPPDPPPRTGSLPVRVARWLCSPAGRDTVAATTAALEGGGDALSVGERLRADGLGHRRAVAVVDAALARRRARPAEPGAERLILTRAGLEQRSHPRVAAWRARRFAGRPAVDLCAGLGGDAVALAAGSDPLLAVERDPARAVLLAHNTAGQGVSVVRGDALAAPVRTGLQVHVDPGRRRGGRRARWLSQYEPPVPALRDALRAAGVAGAGLTVSPAVSWDDRDLPDGAEVEFVQVGGDLLEAVLWTGTLRRGSRRATATLLSEGGGGSDRPEGREGTEGSGSGAGAPTGVAAVTRSRSAARTPLPVGAVGDLLLTVAPAAVRARLHDPLGREIGARRVAARRALLTTGGAPASPWWTRWEVEAVLPPRPAAVARWLGSVPVRPLSIALHGMDVSVDDWLEALGRPARGPRGRRLHLIRTDDGAVAVPTRPLDPA